MTKIQSFFFTISLCFTVLFVSSAAEATLGIIDNLPEKPGRVGRLLQAVLINIDGRRAEVVATQRELVALPAVNPESGGIGEDEKARWIENWLHRQGLPPAERVDSPDERVPAKVRPSLIIRWPGSSGRTLWIVGHLDVLPPAPEALWAESPWVLRVDGDKLYGRGTQDNNQSIATGLIMLQALAQERATPHLGLGLLFVAGGKSVFSDTQSINHVLTARPDLFKPDDLIVVNDQGSDEGGLTEQAAQGVLQLKVTVQGKQAHATQPHQGVNAVQAGAGLIQNISRLHAALPKASSPFVPDVPIYSVTHVEAGSGVHDQIPGSFTFYLDCRFPPHYTADELQAAVRAVADEAESGDGVVIHLERILVIPDMPHTIATAPTAHFLHQAIMDELKVKPQTEMSAATIAAELRSHKLPVTVWFLCDSNESAAEEHASITSHIQSARIFTRMLFYPDEPYAK